MILRRIDGDRHSEVLPVWKGLTVVIIAGGPSLTPEQVDLVRGAREADRIRCIVVNDAYLLAPWADVHYAADAQWHRWHTEGIPKPALRLSAEQVSDRWAGFRGVKCGIDSNGNVPADPAVHLLVRKEAQGNFGLSLDPRALVTGRNSGFQALNLAVLAGAKRVILLGFDGKIAKDGNRHWFGDHPQIESVSCYPMYRQAMSMAESAIKGAGVEVINCSPGTAIDTFQKAELQEVFSWPS